MPDLTEGVAAPDFTLPLDDGSTFQLSAELGWPVVLVAGLGLFDQWLGLRRRLSATAGPAE